MENYPAWYLSSNGPKVSKTIFNIAGSILPMLNMFLTSKGINPIPLNDDASSYISLAVFAYFSVQAGIGYVRSKNVLGAEIKKLGGSVR